jgi:transposase
LRLRYQIALLWAQGWAHRFRADGEARLQDRRTENGEPKVDADLRQALAEMLEYPPTHYGWQRPNWTRELMALELAAQTGVPVRLTTIGRMLRALGARWGERRNSALFIDLLRALLEAYPTPRRIHVILDNCGSHDSQAAQEALATPDLERVKLHFLPPYSPLDNPIERLWRDPHDSVTRNHICRSIDELCDRVDHFPTTADPWPGNHPSIARGPEAIAA